jgi:chromosome partitioning protein
MKSIAFFNNKGGVGKTTLVYHLAYMLSELGQRVMVADIDPQANLTSHFLEEEALETLYAEEKRTILGGVRPRMRGLGDIQFLSPTQIQANLYLLPGHLALSNFEDRLSGAWSRCSDGDESALRDMSAFYRLMQEAAAQVGADLILIDVGPNLGAINRSALLAADHLIMPVAPDLFSLQGLQNLGPTIRIWRTQWQDRINRNRLEELPLPTGKMRPEGYIILQHSARKNRPVKAYQRWADRIPAAYREYVLGEASTEVFFPHVEEDPYCLALLKQFASLMPMAMEARKPVFLLRHADGAIGSHTLAVQQAHETFKVLAHKLLEVCGLPIHQP